MDMVFHKGAPEPRPFSMLTSAVRNALSQGLLGSVTAESMCKRSRSNKRFLSSLSRNPALTFRYLSCQYPLIIVFIQTAAISLSPREATSLSYALCCPSSFYYSTGTKRR